MKRVLLLLAFSAASLARAAPSDDGLEEFLTGFVAKFSKADIDFFYVSPANKGQYQDFVYVYWMTGNAILIVDVPTERQKDYGWYDYKARISLGEEVVPTEDDVQGSTHLVDAPWVEARLKECLNSGRKITLKKASTSAPESRTILDKSDRADNRPAAENR